jgi:hypothetical protein
MSQSLPPSFLSHAELDTVIRLAPLVAMDLIIRNGHDEVLLGLRRNEPAKGCYFVPGGMMRLFRSRRHDLEGRALGRCVRSLGQE